MMNNSKGFENNSLLGSSTGFKKRNLLRPPSGVISKKQEYLRSIDVSQTEPVISTFLRTEIAAIEEEINLLDKDKKLRQGETGLQKGYITGLRKWLRDNQSFQEKEDEDIRILKHLGVENYETGFKKLWRILGHLDLTISKVTELQVIQFLLYDEMYNNIGKDTHRSTNLLQQISNNPYVPSSFQITQIMLERSKDLYSSCLKGNNRSREENRGQQEKSRDQTNQLIAQLKRENAKLNEMLQKLSMEREQDKKKQSQNKSKETKQNHSPEGHSQHQLKQIDQKYQDHIRYLSNEKEKAQFLANQLRTKIGSLEAQLKAATQIATTTSFPTASSGSYEEALMEEMEKMKKGFEKKIAVLTEEFTLRERQIRKRQVEFKTENDKIKWEKSLLLKKFDLLKA